MAQTNVFRSLSKTLQPISWWLLNSNRLKVLDNCISKSNLRVILIGQARRQFNVLRSLSNKHVRTDGRPNNTRISNELSEGKLSDEEFEDVLRSEEHMFLIQPDFKWGKGRFLSKAVNSRLDEAEALVHSVTNWKVTSKSIQSLHELNSKYFFGTGKIDELQKQVEELKRTTNLSAVFVNTGKLTQKQADGLEEKFDCQIFDRYRIVLEIFKERARTKEAKLQVKLAELKYKKSHLTHQESHYDQQRGGSHAIGGGGETHLEVQKRLLAEKETKIKKLLQHVENQRKQNRTERMNKHVAQIALVGYTNAGKTTLAKALSGDSKLEPEDKLFATLDTTVHRGKLPSGMGVVYIDTVGFITDLPHDLIQSFSATLEDVKNANLLVHVRDLSNPEHEMQKKSVLQVLQSLNVDQGLLDSMVEIHNKHDLGFSDESETEEKDASTQNAVPVSALFGSGIGDLRFTLENAIFQRTGKSLYRLEVDSMGDGLSWLHHNTTVVSTDASDNGKLHVQAIMDKAVHSKWRAAFGKGN